MRQYFVIHAFRPLPCSLYFVSLHLLVSVDYVQKAKMLRWITFSSHLLQASGQYWRPQCRLRRWWRPQAAWSPGREGTAPASGPASVQTEGSVLRTNHSHCKEPIQKILKKYYQKRNCAATVPISTLMCLWVIYIFPQSICLFCCWKYVDRSWEYINWSQTNECGNWDWGRAIFQKKNT